MTPEQYNHIGRLFDEALERAPAERADWLREACGTDEELLAAVEKLLAHHSQADTFLSRPALEVAAAQTPTWLGQSLGRYQILSLLGAGGMGEVYLAEDTTLHRKIALKVLPAFIAQDQERLRRFKQEALAASALNHPNIVTIHEFGKEGKNHFIVTELVDGETLRQRLRRGPLALSAALDLTQQIARALQAAHEAGIIHRDIKPENIMIRRDGLVKVLDFGLAKITDVPADQIRHASFTPSHSTAAGAVLGTVAYMSPEQTRGQKVDARSDLWSLGVVLYEMLTGQRPFQGESVPDIFVAILERQPAPLSGSVALVPVEVENLLTSLLTKTREQRYGSAAQLAEELKQLHRQVELAASSSLGGQSVSQSDNQSTLETLLIQTPATTVEPQSVGAAHTEQVHSPAPTALASAPVAAGVLSQPQSAKVRYAIIGTGLLLLIALSVYLFFFRSNTNQSIESIAVLPFENRSGNPELAYISEGLSESLIDQLAELPQLKVIARNSSFKFRGANLDLRQIASQLSVRAILTGSVAQVGEDLIIRFDLVDAINDRQITGGQYQRKGRDVLRIQNEIAQAASQKLRLLLSDSQAKRLAARDTENSDAYRFYLSGLVELKSPLAFESGKLEYSKALEYFEQAVKLDPDFAAAYAEIAWVYWTQANGNGNPHELMPKAKEATARALAIDPNLAKAHVVMATVYEYEFDWAGAEREYKRAIELSPNLDSARLNYAFFLSVMGSHTKAITELDQLNLLDPINRRETLLWQVIIHAQAQKFDEALQAYQAAQALDRNTEAKPFALGYVYAGKEMYGEAVKQYLKAVEQVGGAEKYSQPLVYLAATYARMPEKRKEARALLKRIEAMRGYASPSLLAAVYAALDENDQAMELLERAYLERDLLLRFIKTGYEYDGLRADQRFIALTKRIGLN